MTLWVINFIASSGISASLVFKVVVLNLHGSYFYNNTMHYNFKDYSVLLKTIAYGLPSESRRRE